MNSKKEAVACKLAIVEYMRQLEESDHNELKHILYSKLEVWFVRTVNIQYGKLEISNEATQCDGVTSINLRRNVS